MQYHDKRARREPCQIPISAILLPPSQQIETLCEGHDRSRRRMHACMGTYTHCTCIAQSPQAWRQDNSSSRIGPTLLRLLLLFRLQWCPRESRIRPRIAICLFLSLGWEIPDSAPDSFEPPVILWQPIKSRSRNSLLIDVQDNAIFWMVLNNSTN